jgi:hypothetical protein
MSDRDPADFGSATRVDHHGLPLPVVVCLLLVLDDRE